MRLILFTLLFACGQASSQVIVRVNDGKPIKLDANNLAGLRRQIAVLKDHGKEVNYEESYCTMYSPVVASISARDFVEISFRAMLLQ